MTSMGAPTRLSGWLLRAAFLSITAGVPIASAWNAENPVPTPPPAERYVPMSKQSPFALASAVTPTTAPEASFAANWFVSGIGRLGGADFVTIKARDLSTQFSLFGQEPNWQNGVVLAEVNWSEVVGKSTVTLRKGKEVARLEFNEAEVRGAVVAQAPTRQQAASTSVAAAAGQMPAAPETVPLASTGLTVLKQHAESIRRRALPGGQANLSPGLGSSQASRASIAVKNTASNRSGSEVARQQSKASEVRGSGVVQAPARQASSVLFAAPSGRTPVAPEGSAQMAWGVVMQMREAESLGQRR